MSGTSKRSNDDKTKGTMEASGQSSNNASRVASPGSILQEMSRSGYVPGYPAPGSFPGFPGRSWQDIPPFLLRSFMPPVPLSMDMLSTALLLQGSPIYPTPNSLPMGPLGLMQPPFNTPIFSSNDSLQSSSISKSHNKQDPSIGSKQRASKRTPSETNIYSKNLEQMVLQKNKEVSDGLKHYSPVGYNSPRTKSNKSVEESIIIPGDDEPLDVIKISDDNNAPLALVTKKKSQAEFEDKLPPNLSCQGEQNHVVLPPQLLHRDLDVEPGASRKSATPVQLEERPSSKTEVSKAEVSFDQTPSEQEVPEQKTVMESDSSSLSSKLSIALPPRKRLTRNTEDINEALPGNSIGVAFSCPTSAQPPVMTVTAANSMPSSDSPQSSNFRSCWKKFSAKINNHCPPVHRSYHAAGKPMYDCRAFFQKISGKDPCKPGVLIGKPYLSGNRFYHRARYTPRKEPQVQEGSSSPRITRSQARQKKVNAEESGNNGNAAVISEPQEVIPVRKSLRKKTSNSRYDAPDIVTPGIKTRKPRNSKKNQDDLKSSNATGDNLNDFSVTNNAEKQADECLDQTSKSKNEELASSQDQSSSFERTPDKMLAEDLPLVTPIMASLATEELKASVENRRLDNCDRKSTSSGLSTCSGDVSFDPEFPVSLPPKFRHTKRKPNYAGFVADDKSNEMNSAPVLTAEPSTSSSITCNPSTTAGSSVITATTLSSAASASTIAEVPSTCAPSLPTGATDNAVANASLQSSRPANAVNRPENVGPSNDEQNKAGDSPEATCVSEDALTGKTSTSPRVHEMPQKSDASQPPPNVGNRRSSTNTPDSNKFSAPALCTSSTCQGESKHPGPTKITLKFESDTISTLIATPQHSDGTFSSNLSAARSDPPRRSHNHGKAQENVSEFRLKIDLTELNKKSEEQLRRPVVVLMPETSEANFSRQQPEAEKSVSTRQAESGRHQPTTAKLEPFSGSYTLITRSNEIISCSRKVEIPGSSKPKTISVLLRSRGEAESARSTVSTVASNNELSHSNCFSDVPKVHSDEIKDAAVLSASETILDEPISRSTKCDKRKKKGKGTKRKRQKCKESVASAEILKMDENSNSSTAPVILPSNASSSSLVGNQSSNSPPQLEMSSQLMYTEQFSDISDSEASRLRMSERKLDNKLSGTEEVTSRSSSNQETEGNSSSKLVQDGDEVGNQKSGTLASRKRKRSSTNCSTPIPASCSVNASSATTAELKILCGSSSESISVSPDASSVPPSSSLSFSTASLTGHTNQSHEGKSMDVYDWNANNECDNSDLNDIMRIRQNRLASRLMNSGQPSNSAPLKKRFLPSENQPPNFDNLLSTCKSVSVVVQKLEKEGQELSENAPGSAVDSGTGNDQLASCAKNNNMKKRKKRGKQQAKQESKRLKTSSTPQGSTVVPGECSPAEQQMPIKHTPQILDNLSRFRPQLPLSSSSNIPPDVTPARETRIPPSIRLPQPVVSNSVAPQGTVPSLEGKQSSKLAKGSTKSDLQPSEPVKFKLKKIGRQWISVNDKDGNKSDDASSVSMRKDKEKKKTPKDFLAKKPPKLMSIFMPDSLTQGFVCNDELLQQAFTEKILISEFLKNTFPVPARSGVIDVAPNVSFKFVFDEEMDECEVSLFVDPKEVFFVPTELELLMSAMTLNETKKVTEDREQANQPDLVLPSQVASLDKDHNLIRPEDSPKKKPPVTERGKTVLQTGHRSSTFPMSGEYKKKDELLSNLQDNEDVVNLNEFKMETKNSKNPSFVPLFDEMTAFTLESSDDPWDIFDYHMINVM